MEYKDTKQIYNDVKRKISISNFAKEEKVNMIKGKKSLLKSIAVACCTIVTITGAVFAKDIGGYVSNIFGWSRKGVNTAVENGYVANVNTEYQESNGISVSVDSFLLDDDNFDITFNIKLSDKHKLFLTNYDAEMSRIRFSDFRVENEEGKTIIAEGDGQKDQDDLYSGGYGSGIDKIGENEFKYIVESSHISNKFPMAKKLTITIYNIKIFNYIFNYNGYPEITDDVETDFKGEWKFDLDVPEQMINSRQPIIYKVKSCNDKNIKVDDTAILTNTSFKIGISEIKTDKIDYELLKVEPPKNIYDKIPLSKGYVETSDGKKFDSTLEDTYYYFNKDENTIENYSEGYNLTKFDATQELKLHIFTNIGKEIIIEYIMEKD